MDDPARRRELGQRARQRIIDHLLWNRQEANLLAAYQQLVGSRRHAAPPPAARDVA